MDSARDKPSDPRPEAPDLWPEISALITAPAGDAAERVGKLARLRALWERCPAGRDALRCVIAHYAADLEPLVGDELAWDERALAAYERSEPVQWAALGITDPAGMLPSLHLNLADDFHRSGDLGQARRHLRLAEANVDRLVGSGPYGDTVRAGLVGLRGRIAEPDAT